jgi:LAGLIDADG endonuclease
MAKFQAQWIVGFVDGEGCFHIALNTNPHLRFGKQILPEFTVVQHQRDVDILYGLKSYWQCGVVRQNHGDRMCYRVRKLDDLLYRIVPFFEKHPLKTKKHVEFLKFRDIILDLHNKKHLNAEGFQELCETIKTLRKFTLPQVPKDRVQPLTQDILDDLVKKN